ncbi:hypothetical protein CAEBREN_11966 [Caenorhabditis brenneri]|uniref:Uncharacterized protein n=1 Tax=Caenorhabditis brenneri TaxID=135651 RepID=G0NUQ2_CAEBE|nr:hypothetical protein CAEBREN_11966 [Caenorhabditis brenneri]
MASPTSHRTSLLTSREGLRTQVPEGGELVCYRNEEDQHLVLKVEYSREMMIKLSSSIFCHQRPNGLKQIAEEMPELLGLPQPIPPTAFPPLLDSQVPSPQLCLANATYSKMNSPVHLFSPVRGPVTEADETVRNFISQRELQKRFQNMSLSGESSPTRYLIECSETPCREVRNPRFT